MVDEDKNFLGVVAKELEEECGIKILGKELTELGEMLVSPGGSDEIIHLYFVEK
jgi:ADP-sugar diphosphatase